MTISFSVVVEVRRDFSEVVSVGFVVALDSDVAMVTVDGEGLSGTADVVGE